MQQCRRICERSIGLLSCTLHTSSNPAAHSSHDSHNLPYLLPGRGHPIPSHPIPSLWCFSGAFLVLGLRWSVTLATSADSLVAINWSRAFSSGLCASAPPLARLSASLEPTPNPQYSLLYSTAVSQLPSFVCSSIRPSVYPSVRPSGWFAGYLSVYLSGYLSVNPVHLSICPSVSLLVGSSLPLSSFSLPSRCLHLLFLSHPRPLSLLLTQTHIQPADTRITHIRPPPPFSLPSPVIPVSLPYCACRGCLDPPPRAYRAIQPVEPVESIQLLGYP